MTRPFLITTTINPPRQTQRWCVVRVLCGRSCGTDTLRPSRSQQTPVTPPSKDQSGKEPSASKPDCQSAGVVDSAQEQDVGLDSNDEEYKDVDDDDDEDYAASPSKKRKTKGGAKGDAKGRKAKGPRAPSAAWSNGE